MNGSPIKPDNQQRSESSSRESRETALQTCSECGGRALQDEEHGETVCEECGMVLEEDAIDRGPEWRAFSHEQRSDRRRVGSPTTPLMHDNGLSTTIGWQNRDAQGNPLSASKRAKLQRLRTWDERFRTKNSLERNFKKGFNEIERMASALGLPDSTRETAGVLYRRAAKDELLPGRSIESMATACLYAAARQHGIPRTLGKFTEVSHVEKLPIQRTYRYLSRELNLGIEPTDPTEYVHQFASTLGVSDEARRVACDLLDTAKAQGAHSGKSPPGLAAAALYAATHLTNEPLTQDPVSDVADVSKVTIRNRYQELLAVQESSSDD